MSWSWSYLLLPASLTYLVVVNALIFILAACFAVFGCHGADFMAYLLGRQEELPRRLPLLPLLLLASNFIKYVLQVVCFIAIT